MPLKVTYDEVIDCLVVKATDSIKCDDLLSLRELILNHPKFRQDINQLFECTEGKLDLTTSDLERIASHFSRVADQLGLNRKLALGVSRDFEFGMMRQYEVFFYSGPNVSVRAFKSLSDAREWLKKE